MSVSSYDYNNINKRQVPTFQKREDLPDGRAPFVPSTVLKTQIIRSQTNIEFLKKYTDSIQNDDTPVLSSEDQDGSRTQMLPPILTSMIARYEINESYDLGELLKFAEKYLNQFNACNWAALSNRLFHNRDIAQAYYDNKIVNLLGSLTEKLEGMDAGHIAQIVGGFAPFLHTVPEVNGKLFERYKIEMSQFTAKEAILVLNTIGHYPEMLPYLFPIINRWDSPEEKREPINKNSALLSAMIRCCAQLGQEMHVLKFLIILKSNPRILTKTWHVSRIIQGLAVYTTNYRKGISDQTMYTLNKRLMLLMNRDSKVTPELKAKTLVSVNSAYGKLRYKSSVWNKFFWKEVFDLPRNVRDQFCL